jgi:5-methylcytosine-specific restriction endonuclease McrA
MATDIPNHIRKAALERDRWRCRWCGVTNAGLHLHHIEYRSAGGAHTLENLITLCPHHHAQVHTDKGFYPELLFTLIERRGETGLQLCRRLARENKQIK